MKILTNRSNFHMAKYFWIFNEKFGKILTYHIELGLGCYNFDPVVGIHIDHHNRIHHNRIHLDHGVVVVSLSLLLWFEA